MRLWQRREDETLRPCDVDLLTATVPNLAHARPRNSLSEGRGALNIMLTLRTGYHVVEAKVEVRDALVAAE